jgi:hypothetical protein
MAAQTYSVTPVTLAELKSAGAFVRRQDLDDRRAATRKGEQPVLAYPLFVSRSRADEYIDVFIEPAWRRVQFLGLADDKVHYRDDKGTGSIAYDPYRVAPAGCFTDHVEDVPRPETAELLDTYKPPIPGQAIRSAVVEHVSGPYLTFKIRTFDPNARWVDDHDMRTFSVAVHMLDSRVRIEGVRSRPPLYNFVLAVSHRWLSLSEPDPHGTQFQELMHVCESRGLHDCQAFAIDFCVLPQKPRTPHEDEVFRRELPEFQKLFGRHAIVLGEGSDDYGTRAWCMLELMQASVQNSILNPDVLKGGLAAAYELAKKFADSAKWNVQNISAAFAERGGDPIRGWMSNMENVAIYNQAVSQQNRVLEMFEKELQLSDEADRAFILEQVKAQFHLMKVRTSNWTGLGTAQPLRKQ